MRKTIVREVTTTIAKVAIVKQGENGLPEVEQLPDFVMFGKVPNDVLQKMVNKHYDKQVTIFGVEHDSKRYEMDLSFFVEHATEIVEQQEIELEDNNNE